MLGSSIVSQCCKDLSLVCEWSILTCVVVSEVTTSFMHSYSLCNRYSEVYSMVSGTSDSLHYIHLADAFVQSDLQ